MEARAPAVVAVVVTTGPAPGLDATLSTLVAQDYEELSVLVVANGGDPDVVNRVALVAPNAFVKVLDENRGFAAACNEASLMVEGATFMVFCHDDVLLFEGAISQLVEASFRANAGIVTPKVVAYDDPFTLLHVGQVVDRFGTIRERVELGEIDHGQQDQERDVFVAPGGVTLIRTDLFETLHGFDPLIPALGEDLDICWRAQVAGARVIVAPGAVIAHRETLATGERPVTAVGTRKASRMDLQRRHQLATVLTCWSRHSLLIVVPLLVMLDVAEFILALLGRDTDRAGAIVGSWRWVFRNRTHLRDRRRALGAIRVLKDGDIVRLQVGGASRLKTFVATLFQEGLDTARGMLPELEAADDEPFVDRPSFALAFSEDENFDDIAALDSTGRHQRWGRLFSGARSQLVLIAIVAVIWLYGVRNLVATPLPIIGRLAPLDSWWGTWRHFFASWSPNGTGTGTPGSPGYGVLGFAGTFVFGRMGILPRIALIFAVPFGGWGIWRLLRSVVSNRARLVAAISYVAFPVGANLIERGRIDILVVSAILPFALRRILVLLNVPGFRTDAFSTVPFGHRGWGGTRHGQISVLLLQTALMTAMAPAALITVFIVIAGLAFAQILVPRRRQRLDRPWGLAGNVLLGTALLLLPLAFNTLVAGTRAPDVFGLEGGAWSALGVSDLLRGANGTFGYGQGGWLLPGAAFAALVLARGTRREYAVKFATVLVFTIMVAVLVGRNWLGPFAPDVNVLLVLVGAMIAVLIAITVSAIENDLAPSRLGWHRSLATVAVAVLVVATLPLVAQSGSGRFGLPQVGTPESLGSLAPPTLGGYRVLWLGEPDALPVAGWSVAPGLAAATTTNSLPDGESPFAPPNAGAAATILNAVNLALRGQTVRLGQLLAPAGISDIVVMTAAAPTLPNLQSVAADPPPANLLPSLRRQSDLSFEAHSPGVTIFANAQFHGIIAQRTRPISSATTSSDFDSVQGWQPVLDYGYKSGPVREGTVLAGLTPAGAFDLKVNGHDVARGESLGGVPTFATRAGNAVLVLHQLPINGVMALVTLLMWSAFGLGFGALELLERLTRRRRTPTRGLLARRLTPDPEP
jgi:GT2 family glycosyltransferase